MKNCAQLHYSKRSQRIRIPQILVGISISLWSYLAQSVEVSEGFNITPFLSQSIVHTSDNNFHGKSDDSVSLRSNELGAVFQYQPNSTWLFATQLMARNAGEMDDGNLRVDYLFGQYNFYSSLDQSYNVKLGKLRMPYGLYNETRDIAATNPGFILPQEIYIDKGRNTFFAANGLLLNGDHYWDLHSLKWNIGIADVEPDDEELSDLAGFPTEDNGEGSYQPFAQVMYSHNNDQFKVGLSYRESAIDFTPDIGLDIEKGNLDSSGYLLSAQYNTQKWTWTAEWGRATVDVDFTIQDVPFPIGVPPFFVLTDFPVSFEFPSESYYLQAEYRFHKKFTLMMRHGESYANRHDRKGQDFANGINQQIMAFPGLSALSRPAHAQYAIDNTLGLTWNISPKMMARAEWHNVEGTFWLSTADNTDSSKTKKYWDIVSLQFAYRF